MTIQLNLPSPNSDPLIHYVGRDNSISILLCCSRSEYNSIASVNQSFRQLFRSGELYNLRRLNGIIEHWVFLSSGFYEWKVFHPVLRKWMHLPKIVSNCFMWPYRESIAVGTDLLVFCRVPTTILTYRYSILTNSWTSDIQMNNPRCLFGSATLGTKTILAGGCDIDDNILSSAELYNSDTKNWEVLPNMKTQRKLSSGVFMDNKFYMIGGIGGDSNEPTLLTCAEEFDLEMKTWKVIPYMSADITREGQMLQPTVSPFVAVVNNELFAADLVYLEIKKYDKVKQVWSTIGRLHEPISLQFWDLSWGLALKACGNRLMLIGGSRFLEGGFIEIYSTVPQENGDLQWDFLVKKHWTGYVYSCAVMGC